MYARAEQLLGAVVAGLRQRFVRRLRAVVVVVVVHRFDISRGCPLSTAEPNQQ